MGRQLAKSCDLEAGTETGKLCITLLDEDCCHSNRRGICDGYALSAKLIYQLIINIADGLVREGALTWSVSIRYRARYILGTEYYQVQPLQLLLCWLSILLRLV